MRDLHEDFSLPLISNFIKCQLLLKQTEVPITFKAGWSANYFASIAFRSNCHICLLYGV